MLAQRYNVSTSGQMSLPAKARRRWGLDRGGSVDVLDLGFGVLILPSGGSAELLDRLLPADEHLAFVHATDDPDLITT